jgi:putative sterol carrier protein
MTTFLSREWMDALLAALNGTDETRGVHLTLQQTVTGTPDGDVDYWLTFDDGTVTGGLGRSAADADVTMALDHETATGLSRGDLNAQSAFMQGKLKITGNMGKLLLNQAAIEALGPAMSSIDTG